MQNQKEKIWFIYIYKYILILLLGRMEESVFHRTNKLREKIQGISFSHNSAFLV